MKNSHDQKLETLIVDSKIVVASFCGKPRVWEGYFPQAAGAGYSTIMENTKAVRPAIADNAPRTTRPSTTMENMTVVRRK